MQGPHSEWFLLGLFLLFVFVLSPTEINAKTFSGRKSFQSTNSPLRMLSASGAGKAGSPPPGAKPTEAAMEAAEATL